VDQEHDGQCKNHGAPNGVAPGAKIGSFGFAMPTEQIIAHDNYPEPDTMSPSQNAASHKNPSKRNYYHNKSPKNVNARYHEDDPTNKITCNCNQPNNDSAKTDTKTNIPTTNNPSQKSPPATALPNAPPTTIPSTKPPPNATNPTIPQPKTDTKTKPPTTNNPS
jgi:hypothetical protein